MRKRYIQHPITFELIPAEEYSRPEVNAPMVMGDISPYQSMIDGTMITSRSQHRTHLRDNGCIEIGNEVKALKSQVQPRTAPPGLREQIARAVHQRL